MDHYVDDLAAVNETLQLKKVVLVGFSTGGGEVARYVAQLDMDIAAGPFFGFNSLGVKVSQGLIDHWWLQGSMLPGYKNTFDSIKAFSASDMTEDLKMIDRPTMIVHGDDDQIVPIDTSVLASVKLVKGAQLHRLPRSTPRTDRYAQGSAEY